uniref:TonB-dependent receptor n=1 Tax=Altererythrobacter segetis TaxID=1104773 RepID=UPI00140B8C1F|nr:TonB-dependent receptor [Altererythrobacter segetis]
MRSVLISSVAAAALLPHPAFAQEQAAPAPAAETAAAPAADSPAIVVTGTRVRRDDILGNVTVLGGDSLIRDVRPTIGETLAKQPGVSTSGSGPNVARPVLRGLAGERLLILTDGIGSLDVSASSSDHAVAINPLTAENIEVLHGPAALLYGSSAVGGVVNVIDSRIPRRMPDGPVALQATGGFATAASEVLASGEADVPLGGHFVAHADAGYTHNDDLRTGGFILSKPLRDEAAASADAQVRALADLKGDLPNSDGRTFEAAGALAWIDGNSNLGFSVAHRTAFYGVPVRYSLDPAIEAERTHIDVHQTRYDARAEFGLPGPFERIKLRGAYSDYHHDEVGDDGAIGSSVFSKGGEARADLVQRDRGGWDGQTGVQFLDVRQHIDGDEQYLPPVENRTLGLFSLQHFHSGPFKLEAGGRFEHTDLSADASAVVGNPALERSFSTFSGSLGGSYEVAAGWRLGLNLARSMRAPSADELFADGPHGGNASFELGDPDLSPEKSLGFEATISHAGDGFNLSATAYGSHFSNFLYQAPTGEVRDDLPVYASRQGRANYTGFEVSADADLGEAAGLKWGIEGQADATRVRIRNFGPAPLIPPLRLKGAVSASRGAIAGRVELEHDFAQRSTAPLELPTAGFTLVNASADWHPFADRPDLTLSLAANNLFDVAARRSTSLLKDYAPLAGRDVRLTLNLKV